jgi:glycosyltransferase involved in cell wall biosynthesis
MIVPSREETFGQTASEALACGTPVVCFDCTGLRDVVDHLETGYRAVSFDVGDLANGIIWVLEDDVRRQRIARRARERAEEVFSIENQARLYSNLYQVILDRRISGSTVSGLSGTSDEAPDGR